MNRLSFVSPHEATVEGVSPLRKIASTALHDVSSLGKLEVRGDIDSLDVDALPIGRRRALVVCDGDVRPIRDELLAAGYRVYDQTAALAAFEVHGEGLMRRLTTLNLEQLPAKGAILRDTPALIERREGVAFRLFVPQELAHAIAEAIDDIAQGLDA